MAVVSTLVLYSIITGALALFVTWLLLRHVMLTSSQRIRNFTPCRCLFIPLH